MSGVTCQGGQCPDELQILTFTVMGVKMAVDTSQMDEMLEVGQAATRGLFVSALHEEISFASLPVMYCAPKVLSLKGQSHRGIMIDRPEDIATVKIDAIQRIPSLIAEGPGAARAIWGAVVRNDEIILLLDFMKLSLRTTPDEKIALTQENQARDCESSGFGRGRNAP